MHIALKADTDENAFIGALVKNEKWAQKELYERYYSKLMGICMRYAKNKDDARDLLHDGFIKVLNKIHKYTPGTSLNAWVCRIIVNNCIDNYRKQSIRRTEDIDTAYDISSKTEDAVAKCGAKELLSAIQLLPDSYKMVFNLFAIEGYPHKDIANMMNISESTSRSNLSKARAKLQGIIKEKYPYYGRK